MPSTKNTAPSVSSAPRKRVAPKAKVAEAPPVDRKAEMLAARKAAGRHSSGRVTVVQVDNATLDTYIIEAIKRDGSGVTVRNFELEFAHYTLGWAVGRSRWNTAWAGCSAAIK